jgi:two-component sensor histidine kinase/PAS domain-containing protein
VAILALSTHGFRTMGPPFGTMQVSATLYVPACAVLIWANRAQRHAAEASAMAEALLGEVFRQIPGAVSILEAPAGRLVLSSTHSDAVLGRPPGKFTSYRDLEPYGGLHGDGRPYRAEEYPISRALISGEIVQGEKLRYRRPDGVVVDLEVHAGPVRGQQGQIIAAVGMAFDVTERAAAERALQESELRYRAVAERMRVAVDAGALGLWEFDLTTQRYWVDARCAAMLGLPQVARELTRSEMQAVMEPNDQPRISRVIEEAIARGDIYADEVTVGGRGRPVRWLVTGARVLRDVGKLVGVVSDVTERRQREDALREALNARDLLMREADHRIKNSLQMVVSMLRLQLTRMSDADTRNALVAAIARVDAVADAHLALQRSENLRTIDIDQMLLDMSERMGSLNPALTVRCVADAGLHLDAEQAIPLGLIVSELLTNALRHAYPPDTPGTVTLSATADATWMELQISDDGVGLPVSAIRSGLGTTVVNALARQIGATVARETAPGAGTTVRLRLRLAHSTSADGAAQPLTSPALTSPNVSACTA